MKIKFCGGCNPFYDRKKLYIMLLKNKKIQKLDKIIILNGCQRGCRKSLKNKNIINVQEYIINNDLKDINSNIKLYILGDGPDFNILKNKAEELGLLNKTVYLKGFLPYEKMITYLKSADIALNSIKGKALQTITNKFGDYVSAGLPLLNCCQSNEIITLIEEKKLGLNYTPGNIESFKEKLFKMLSDKNKMKNYSENCKKFAEEKFDRKESYRIIEKKIEEILNNGV